MKKIKTTHRSLLADQLTPVSIYLQMRDRYPNALLLESTDYHHLDNCYSFICLEPIAEILLSNGHLQLRVNHEEAERVPVEKDLPAKLRLLFNKFSFEQKEKPFDLNGFFGYMNYDAISYYEDVDVKKEDEPTPALRYSLFRYVLQFHHLKNSLTVLENRFDDSAPMIDQFIDNLNTTLVAGFQFTAEGEEQSEIPDERFREMVATAKSHIQRGDIFQIVLSRKFSQPFSGDEFNVYRQLRHVNPSPYLFYYDYSDYKLMGSSPEIQIKVESGKATVNPIAGTFRRTGNDEQDQEQARKLLADPKENAEHTMLVDLARNDLSRCATNVKVDVFKEIQFYSHVIHIVSKVSGFLTESYDGLDVLLSTFPAGTLSGAPKVRAMQLIDELEASPRGFYGGAIGLIAVNGDINHAIMIRTIKSRDQQLIYRAGAGIVSDSNPESELREVDNKIGALRKAIQAANEKI
jgi:anthranilate synthase component I